MKRSGNYIRQLPLWRLCLGRAWRNACKCFGLNLLTVILIICDGVFGFAAMYWVVGKQEAMQELAVFIVAFLVGGGVIFIAVFLWNLWLAPFQEMEERLEDALQDREERRGETGVRDMPRLKAEEVSAWQKVELFKLGEAACIWADVSPHDPIENEDAKAKFSELSGAITLNQLQYRDHRTLMFGGLAKFSEYKPAYDTQVTAIALRRYADSKNDVPQFLENVKVPPPEPAQLPKPQEENGD